MYDPGRDAAERHADWVIRHRDLRGAPEVMCPVRRVILIETAHGWPARRCSLAHAVAHIDLEHRTSPHGVLSARQELAADRLAARRLIDVHHLADALMWTECVDELAAALQVEARYLAIRRDGLHPCERHYLYARLEQKEWAA